MGLSVKNFMELGEAVLKLTPLAPFGVAVGAASNLFPDDKPDERAWKVRMIPQWKAKCRELMDIPMNSEIRKQTLSNRIDADFFTKYGERPERRWVENLRRNIVFAVRAEIASSTK